MSDEGLFDYFEKLIEEINHSKLKIYLYHIPQVSGVGLSIDLVSKLKNLILILLLELKTVQAIGKIQNLY